MRGINISVWVCPARSNTDAVVIIWNNILEPILFTVPLQRRQHTVTLESFLSNLFKLGKQLTLQLTLESLTLPTDTISIDNTLRLKKKEKGTEEYLYNAFIQCLVIK